MKIFVLTMLFLLGAVAYAQDGNSYYEQKDYYNASKYYEIEVKKEPSKYLNLAKSYFALKQFDKSVKAMESYKNIYAGADISEANQWLELLRRDDEEVEMRPIESINTSNSEYIPHITKDGETLYFVSPDRKEGMGGEDIYFSKKQPDGSWASPQSFKDFNSKSHEGLLAMSADENVVILFGNYPGSFGNGDLFYSIKVDGKWTYPCNLGGNINTSNWEAQANLSADGRFLLFASNRPEGHGNEDLYVAELTDNGWSTPINLGPTINTNDTDLSPFLAADGKTLYFASEGHFGFGQRDMFVAQRLDDSWTNWSKPTNLGKYINTLGSDNYLTIPGSGSRGYIVGSGGIETGGSSDIFEFILPPRIRPEALFHVYGTVTDEKDSAAAVIIRYIDVKDGKEVAKTVSSEVDGSYAVSIPSFKKYQVVIDMKGFLYYSTILDLTDPSKYFKKKTFPEVLGEDYDLLSKSNFRMDKYGVRYDTLLEADAGTDMGDNFERMIQLAQQYEREAAEMDRVLRNARYEYLTELENQREVMQDHEVTRIKVGARFEVENIFFDFGKATLRAESKEELDKLYDIMNRSEIVIEFGGHTDNVGSEEANLELSQERVNAVKEYLVSKGINKARIAAVGYGESQPIADNESEEGRQKNRRVELQITQLRLQREGADEITGEEEFDGLKEASLLMAGNTVQVDLLEKFRKAAEQGGMPGGADCGAAVDTYDNDVVETKTNTKDKSSSFDWGSNAIDDLDDYIYKSFNPYLASYGTASYGGALGAGVAFVKESNLRELHFRYNFMNAEPVKWSGTGEILWTVRALSPFHIHYGLEATLMGMDSNDGMLYMNIPVGARYIFTVSDIILGPEFIYSFQALASDNLGGETGTDLSSKYIRVGVNARWKFVQGGLFLNKGDFVDYAGFRAGFAF